MNRLQKHPITLNIFVLILTYRQREKTLACLSNLLARGDIPFKVLVWDNGSNEDTLAAVRSSFPDVLTRYSEENLGVAGGRNASARMAIREYGATHLLFLDNDILVEPGFVGALFEPFEMDPQLGQTQAKLRFMHDRSLINDGGGARISFVLWRVKPVGFGEPDRGQYDTPHPCISCGGPMMVRADVFQKLNGFDPLFGPFGPEDLDFSLRLQKLGNKAMYIAAHHAVGLGGGGGVTEPALVSRSGWFWDKAGYLGLCDSEGPRNRCCGDVRLELVDGDVFRRTCCGCGQTLLPYVVQLPPWPDVPFRLLLPAVAYRLVSRKARG